MENFEVKLQVYNNQLKQRRHELGFTQAQLAEAADIGSASLYSAFERMDYRTRDDQGAWTPLALKLANFHCVEPEELFPPDVEAMKISRATRRLSSADLRSLLSVSAESDAAQQRLLTDPEGRFLRKEAGVELCDAVDKLTLRQRQVIKMRFGLGKYKTNHTLEEIAAKFGMTRERIRQVEARALRRLRHPTFSKSLRKDCDSQRYRRGSGDSTLSDFDEEVELLGLAERRRQWQAIDV